MGIVAVVGCAVAIVVVLTAMVSSRAWGRRQPELWAYGVMAPVALAFYTKDGLGALFALFVGPEIRTGLRLYVVIGMFGLLAVGRMLTTVGADAGSLGGDRVRIRGSSSASLTRPTRVRPPTTRRIASS